MKLSASNNIGMIFQGTVEERNKKFPHFKTLLSLICLHTNALKFYSLLFNFVKITIQYGNYKEIPSWKETTENLRMHSVTWQSTLGEFVNSHRRE